MKRRRTGQTVIVATVLALVVGICGPVGECQASTDRPAVAGRESGRGSAREAARKPASDPRAVALGAAFDHFVALFEPQVVEVGLGSSGETIALQKTPDGGYTLNGEAFVPGSEVTASNGNVYVLTLSDGIWMATYQPAAQAVPLGTSGILTLTRAEDGTWASGERLVNHGETVVGSNGISYRLTFVNGYWSARVLPKAVRIAGTPLFATPFENGRGYRVGTSALLPASGRGNVTVDGAQYRVWMEDGQLRGARFDTRPHGRNEDGANYQIGLTSGHATLSEDNRDTVANEARTTLIVGRGQFALGELFDVGTASFRGDNFVQQARDEIQGLRKRAELVIPALEDDDDALSRYLSRIWTDVQVSIDRIFGQNNKVVLARATDKDEILGALDAVLDALSTETAFRTATQEGGTGIFKAAGLDEAHAQKLYRAQSLDSRVMFGVTGGTRYGAVRTKARDQAIGSLQDVELGAFGYSTIRDLPRTSSLPDDGSASYEGGTIAISGDKEFYTGKIKLLVGFRSSTVSGLITEIKDEDGSPWTYHYGAVKHIRFPDARLMTTADWSSQTTPAERAQIDFEDTSFLQSQYVESSFVGHLLGIDEDAASEAVGVWSVGSSTDKSNYLMGGFGVLRVVNGASEKPVLDEGEKSETVVVPVGTEIGNGILTLRGTQYGPDLTTTATEADWDDEVPLLDAGRRIEDVASIPLRQLFSRRGSERTFSGRNLMGLARQEIGQLREQLAEVIALSDDTAGLRRQRSRIWDLINERVRARVFGTADRALAGRDFLNDNTVSPEAPRKWSSGYPVSQDGRPDDDEALLAVDTVLAALANPTALEAAISGGVFTRADGKPFRALAAETVEDVWRRSESRVKVSLGATDYTRFGAWRKQTAPSAWSAYSDRLEEDENGPSSFAYSPLPQSRLAGLNFPVGGSGTYQGETVAVQRSTFFKGSIELTAQWHAGLQHQHEVGLITAIIRDLQDENGSFLTYTIAATGQETAINAFIFDDISIQADTESRLYFSTSNPHKARLRLVDLFENEVNFAADPTVSVSIDGKFVGQLLDGPLGVIGTWTLRDGGDTRTGTGDRLAGAFGAELKP